MYGKPMRDTRKRQILTKKKSPTYMAEPKATQNYRYRAWHSTMANPRRQQLTKITDNP